MRTLRVRVWILAIAAVMSAARVAQAQQSGTVFSQTLTVVKGAANPAFDFDVAGGNNGKSANSVTTVFIEFGAEGNAAPPEPDPNLPNTVLFKVSKGGVAGTSDFTTAGGVENVKFTNKIVILTKGQENTGDPRGLYRLLITHIQGVPANTTESWKLEVTNIPNALRMIASIDQGIFKTLTPTGVCSGGACPPCNCPSACPPGSYCQPWKDYPIWKYAKLVIWPKWPWPSPCLSCPRPWDEPIPDGFDRVMVSFNPFVKENEPLGPGRAGNIKVNISGGQAIGPLFDTGRGEYLQLVQYRKGEAPRVSASVGDVKSEEVVASAQGEGVNPIFRTLTYALIVLLLVALVAIWSLRRPRSALDRRA